AVNSQCIIARCFSAPGFFFGVTKMAKYSNTSVAGFAEYMEARGREIRGTWTDEIIDAALLLASEWIDGVYGRLFSGQKAGGFLQDREWPRTGAYSNTIPVYTFPSDVIPDQIAS